jgi:glycosyltransferase involved in cell wall biosynthesis
MQKCLFIVHSFGGGAEQIALTVLQALDRKQYLPIVACLHPLEAWRKALASHSVCLMPKSKSIASYLHFWWQLVKLVQKADIAIGSLELQSLLAAALLAQGKAIGWVHKDIQGYLSSKSLGYCAIYSIVLRFALRRCRQIICVSDGAKQALSALFPHDQEKICRIYNPVPLETIKKLGQEPLATELQACFSRPVILAVGRLAPEKQFDVLIKAFHLLRQGGLDAHLCIMGEGAERHALEQLRHQLGRDEDVFLPGRTMPYAAMARARLCVLSSRFEGLPTVIIEALALGRPVVSTDCPSGPRELLANGIYGQLVPLNTNLVPILAKALSTALAQPETAELCKARQQWAEQFSKEKIIRIWENILQQDS